ncbi:uncharacterized protein LOC123301083 [Chrysoperla carnea]|uniref:uncharacterized protein LOC123301083 n=1 Tax=Chrysoperla carnea TaxID=189513 RepID=UPI001D064BED|nr:uncharacterized protein LOC123301083 [Chrysoperla carnea]
MARLLKEEIVKINNMSGMVLQYNSPEIYILGSTNKIQELNMDGLFVSPAGRELMKQKSQNHHKTKIKHSNEFSKTLPTLSLLTETTDIRTDIPVIPTTTIYTNEDNFKKNSLDIVPFTTTTTIADCIESTSSTATSSYYSTPSSTSCSSSMKINSNNADNDDANQESCSLQSQSKHAKNKITIVEENEKSYDEQMNESEYNRTNENYYEEELELLLGINCVLEDDCRCFECQSTYFDYTEDDDFEESLESIKNPNNSPPTNTGSCRRHHTNHATNMYCCIQ